MSAHAMDETFPSWLRTWWRWSSVGLVGWGGDVFTVIGWGLAVAVLTLIAPMALAGVACRWLVAHQSRSTYAQSFHAVRPAQSAAPSLSRIPRR